LFSQLYQLDLQQLKKPESPRLFGTFLAPFRLSPPRLTRGMFGASALQANAARLVPASPIPSRMLKTCCQGGCFPDNHRSAATFEVWMGSPTNSSRLRCLFSPHPSPGIKLISRPH